MSTQLRDRVMSDTDKALELLIKAARQYRHNYGEGFVMGYDKAETESVVESQLAETEKLQSQLDQISHIANGVQPDSEIVKSIQQLLSESGL